MIQQLLKEIGYNAWIYKEGRERNLYTLETLCNQLSFGFNPTTLMTDKEKAMYLKGFFDAEGGVPRTSGKFYIQLTQKDYEKVNMLKTLLEELGIKTGKIHNPSKRVDPHYWRIFIRTKHHNIFARTIGSFHPIKGPILRERMKI